MLLGNCPTGFAAARAPVILPTDGDGRAEVGAGTVDSGPRVGAVTVVVVTHDSADVIDGALMSLTTITDPSLRVVVVDNASSDDTVERARRFPGVVVVEAGGNDGYAAGANTGARHARPRDHVLFANADVVWEPDTVRTLSSHVSRDPSCGIAFPMLCARTGELQHSIRFDPPTRRTLADAVLGGTRAGRWGVGEVERRAAAYSGQRDVDWASGAAMLVSRACLDDLGGLDESFFLYSEETEFCQRARRRGWRVQFVPQARVVHDGGGLQSVPWLYALRTRNRLRLHARSNAAPRGVMFRLATLLHEVLRCRSSVHRAGARAALGLKVGSR